MMIPVPKGQVAVQSLTDGAILLHLSDNLFDAGSYHLSARALAEITNVLKLLRPYSDKLHLTFIGHTDTDPVTRNHDVQKVIQNNIDLSSVRAAQAVEFAAQVGFDPRWMVVQCMAEHGRASRTISIQIEDRKRALQ